MELTSTNTEEVFEGRSAFVDNLGAIALGILAIGVVYQQYQISSRGGLTNYGIRHLQQDYYSSPSIFSRRRVRKQPKFPGYGLVSAASTAYNAITSELHTVSYVQFSRFFDGKNGRKKWPKKLMKNDGKKLTEK